ncbi:MAG: NAD(P)H-dependent glycerol-3-phosphate dehydrogenase, partial [Thermoanaerobaculia bacterium]
EIAEHIDQPVSVVSGTKGIENETLERMSEVSSTTLGGKLRRFAALSGPTFAAEVVRGDPTAAVIASTDVEFAQELQRVLSSGTFRLYNSTDVVGVEFGGSLKNVIAIAAGVVEGLGLGSNTNAALITRGLHEITRLGMTLGGKLETFAGLAGMGDLVLTCTGALSRNRSVGVALGRGKKLDEILDESKFVAEGVKTSKSAKELAERHGIEMPITSEMYRVLYEGESPRAAIQRLMSRSLKAEHAR